MLFVFLNEMNFQITHITVTGFGIDTHQFIAN
ncbi:MAG: hypothetical protein JWQ79_3510 [Mucilaginibacter sp.]|nr:hypothetical protein [Mucilaginibacter sp.]